MNLPNHRHVKKLKIKKTATNSCIYTPETCKQLKLQVLSQSQKRTHMKEAE